MLLGKHFAQLMLLPGLASAPGASAAQLYEVAIAPAGFSANQLNNRGQVIGMLGGRPAIWYGNKVSWIPALEGRAAGGMNNRGDIVGGSIDGPFVYARTGLRNIPVEPSWDDSAASHINDAGQVIGNGYTLLSGMGRGFLYSAGGTRIIDAFGAKFYSYVYGINNAGHVVGIAQPPNGFGQHAFLDRDGVVTDLGTLGGFSSQANDINDAGQIVGNSETVPPPGADEFHAGPTRAFLYERGTMKDLGTLGGMVSRGLAINNGGIVVGDSYLPGNMVQVAFVYARGQMTDLNMQARLPQGWTLVAARDVNDRGQILARACNLDDCNHWARLTPRPESRLATQQDAQEKWTHWTTATNK
jgi:probable HAF family extracellular repeat protein